MTEHHVSPKENERLFFSSSGQDIARLAYLAHFGLLGSARNEFIANVQGVKPGPETVGSTKEFQNAFDAAMLQLPVLQGYPSFVDAYAELLSSPFSELCDKGAKYVRNLAADYKDGPEAAQRVWERAAALAETSFARREQLKEVSQRYAVKTAKDDYKGTKVIPGYPQPMNSERRLEYAERAVTVGTRLRALLRNAENGMAA